MKGSMLFVLTATYLHTNRNVGEHSHINLCTFDRFNLSPNGIFGCQELLLRDSCTISFDSDAPFSECKGRALSRPAGWNRKNTLVTLDPFDVSWCKL